MSIISRLGELGLIAQVSATEELEDHLNTGSRTVYCGFDPTADSLQIGNLVPLLALRRFQLSGHRPLLLVGGATGMIGDPGGRDSERELQTPEAVERKLVRIREQAARFLDFDCGDTSALIVNNMDWTSDLTVIDFLRDIGKHFSVNAMIRKESVRRRIEDDARGISYAEFSYMVLQSWDFAVLNRDYGCTIQMGGSDQWGNITAGIDLIRRMGGGQTYAVTYPLITGSDGAKLGKSSGGAIWLDPQMTSPFSFYQFWRNTADADVMNYLRVFTLLDEQGLQALEASSLEDPGGREAQITLAREVTRLVHDEPGLAAAERITTALFGNWLADLSADDLGQLAQDGMDTTHAGSGTLLTDLLVESGLAVTPLGEVTPGLARKLIQSNSVSVNGEKVSDLDMRLTRSDALHGKYFVVQKGRKNHHLVVVDG